MPAITTNETNEEEPMEPCIYCQKVTVTEDMSMVSDTGLACSDCCYDHTFICQDCDERYDSDDLSYAVNAGTLCAPCFSQAQGFTCTECGCCFRGDTYGSNGQCEDCYAPMPEDEDEDRESDMPETKCVIKNYSYKVERNLSFKGASRYALRHPLFMGVELEIEVKEGDKNKAASHTQELLDNFAALKEDGSLTFGFEIVSAPATLEYHQSGDPIYGVAPWDAFFEARKTTLKGLRSYDTDTCGMHIHLSRAALTKLQISKMNVFLNEPSNKDFVTLIAGRSDVAWCHMIEKKHTDTYQIVRDFSFSSTKMCPKCGDKDQFESGPGFWICSRDGCCDSATVEAAPSGAPAYTVKVKGHGPKNGGDRRQALNLNNEHTIEIRIFKGTLNKASFFKNIEFAHALAMFSGESSLASLVEATTLSASISDFKKYLDNCGRKLYPNLVKFLEDKMQMPKRKAKAVNLEAIARLNTPKSIKKLKEIKNNVSDYQETV